MTHPTPDDYTRCIGCGADFAPPSGTELCPLCCRTNPTKETSNG